VELRLGGACGTMTRDSSTGCRRWRRSCRGGRRCRCSEERAGPALRVWRHWTLLHGLHRERRRRDRSIWVRVRPVRESLHSIRSARRICLAAVSLGAEGAALLERCGGSDGWGVVASARVGLLLEPPRSRSGSNSGSGWGRVRVRPSRRTTPAPLLSPPRPDLPRTPSHHVDQVPLRELEIEHMEPKLSAHPAARELHRAHARVPRSAHQRHGKKPEPIRP
jgi:hypothetical protein